ncbi:MAG: SMP-30/gluconolactonase/LRE family protein [Candidatus Rokuibacteriota bacterium]
MITNRARGGLGAGLALVAGLLVPATAPAEIVLPAGFTARVYVTGDGFGGATAVRGRGIPTTPTLAVDRTGALYLARSGRRYSGGEFDYLSFIYRIKPGGAELTPENEPRYFHGAPLNNAQVSGDLGGRELLVTTFDRDRRVGVLYRLVDGRVQLFAGGTPDAGTPPILIQPEGAAVDSSGNVYVADRARGVVVRLDSTGRVLDSSYVRVIRPRTLTVDEADHLWVGSDGAAEAPWQAGPGAVWRVAPGGERRLMADGPVAQGLTPGPGGSVFVADRHGSEIFGVTADGSRMRLARFTNGDAPRGLAFVPDTAETRAAGLAGDLLVSVIRTGVFQLNQIVRISGPFAKLARRR